MFSDLNNWFKQRPAWLQEAASVLLRKGSLADEDVETFFGKYLQEVQSPSAQAAVSFPADAFQTQAGAALRLCSISNVQGINALAPRQPLDFGAGDISIVYGANGSGKSGYIRILKHVCGARNAGVLLQNVFADTKTAQSADIAYQTGDEQSEVCWAAEDGVAPMLRAVDIFDSDTGRTYLEGESEVSYEPAALRFFSDLIAFCDKVSRRIDDEMAKYPPAKPQMPAEFADTAASQWYAVLNKATPTAEVATHTKWDAADNKAATELRQRLSHKAPADRAKALLAQKKHLDDMAQSVERCLQQLSAENCRRILQLKRDKATKRATAQAAATKVFDGAPLEGIGTQTWQQLWAYARQYSEELAYPEQHFPHVDADARCVLCQQPLCDEARDRMTSFEEFVQGRAEQEAKAAEKRFADALAEIGDIPTDETVKTQCDAGGLAYDGEQPPVVEGLKALRKRKAGLQVVDTADALPVVPDFAPWLREVRERSSQHADAAKKWQADAESDTRQQLQKQLLELRARNWLAEQRPSVDAEIWRLKTVEQLGRAKQLADTRGLSRKKGELAQELISEAFVQRFREELEALGAPGIRVELAQKRVSRGHVLHELRLVDAHSGVPRDILSEGEHRIVCLAAFLADVTGKQRPAPFVFDDPISSLDHVFEEAVAQRLVRLEADRQVIVFTHRISLLVLLQDYAKQAGRKHNAVCIRSESWGNGEPGSTPLFIKRPDKALNMLLNERLAKARKTYYDTGHEDYEPLAKAICRDFRVLLERMIEWELMADVVQRFRREVITKDKLAKLARVTPEDCLLFDALMTRYSLHEHSQPDEAPVALPLPEELQADMEQLQDWRAGFVQRRIG